MLTLDLFILEDVWSKVFLDQSRAFADFTMAGLVDEALEDLFQNTSPKPRPFDEEDRRNQHGIQANGSG